jgi:predicted transposase YbfD/YdcC
MILVEHRRVTWTRKQEPMATALSCSPSLPAAPALPSLLAALRRVPEHRDPRGRRHELAAVLALSVVGVLAGHSHPLAISEWGRQCDPALTEALGFSRPTPAPSTFHEIFKRLDGEAFARELREWALSVWRAVDPKGCAACAGDGKAVRGSARAGSDVAHLLSVFCGEFGITLDLAPVEAKTGELPGAAPLLLRVGVAGRIFTLDALFTHEPLAASIVAGGGDYVLPVKGNQVELRDAIQETLAAVAPVTPAGQAGEEKEGVTTATTDEKGHGRRETRRLVAVSLGALEEEERWHWGGAQQIFRIERWRLVKDRQGQERYSYTIHYGITSLAPEAADAKRLLGLVRGHWQIENRSHWVRDVELREDATRTATGAIVEVQAGIRCAALTLLHQFRRQTGRCLAATRRRLHNDPWQGLALIRGTA